MAIVLTAMLAFLVKHFVCDFVLQPYSMVMRKGDYLHPAGLAHAGIHAAGSVPPLLILTHRADLIAALIGGEFLVHYHVDWLKAQLDRRLKFDMRGTPHWAIFGADQLIHQATNLAMIVAVLQFG